MAACSGTPISFPLRIAKSTVLLVNLSTETSLHRTLAYSCITAGPWKPVLNDTQETVIYFQTPQLDNTFHKIDVVVTIANETNMVLFDYFRVSHNAGPSSVAASSTSSSTPSSTDVNVILISDSPDIPTIVGGVVGGVVGAVLLVLGVVWYLRKRSRGNRAYYFETPSPAEILGAEGV